MSAIAGINARDQWDAVRAALSRVSYRGDSTEAVIAHNGATVGEIHNNGVKMWLGRSGGCRAVCAGAVYNWQTLAPDALDVDAAIEALYARFGPRFVGALDGAFALAVVGQGGLFVARDTLGISPLYYGESEGCFCFASEAKALLALAKDVREFPPGHHFRPSEGFVPYATLPTTQSVEADPVESASELRRRLAAAVAKCVHISADIGCWLSGGLDSSTVAGLARLQVPNLNTFAVGTDDGPDLEHARLAAKHIGSRHHELRVAAGDLLRVLPEVVYHLESFDALLVRSSVTNYLLARMASEHVKTVLSGEGADELFAGYDYLAELGPNDLPAELRRITGSLHNTALQRVDRCSAAHGLVAHVPYLDSAVVNLAFSLPAQLKLHRNSGTTAKWILRKAAEPLLPSAILRRPKAKFWQGAGVSDLIERAVEQRIGDDEFEAERVLPDGSMLASKEELHYYRLFRDHFGQIEDCGFVGRTPVHCSAMLSGSFDGRPA